MSLTETAYIALGSNLGNREQSIRSAIDQLNRTPGIRVIQVSSLLDNPAVGGPLDSPPFLNAVASIETSLAPTYLLQQLLTIEQQLGRHRLEKWGPRSIDLDLLLYGNQIIQRTGLTVPHPLMHTRRFVLKPLVEIAPGAMHPLLGKSARQLLADCSEPTSQAKFE